MFGSITKVFNMLLSFSGALNNQPCMTKSTVVELNPDEHNQ